MNKSALICLLSILSTPAFACSISTAGGDIQMEPVSVSAQTIADYGQVSVTCPAGTQWVMEIGNAQPGGRVPLVGLATGNTIDAAFSLAQSGQALGAATYGEGLAGEGTGSEQIIALKAEVYLDRLPAADTYVVQPDLVLVF